MISLSHVDVSHALVDLAAGTASHPLLAACGDAGRHLEQTGRRRTCLSGEPIRGGVGTVSLVLAGAAALTTADQSLFMTIIGPGDLFGEGALAGLDTAPSGRWLTAGTVMDLATVDILETVDAAVLLPAVLAASVRRQTAIAQELACVTEHTAAARLARLMLGVHRVSGERTVTITQMELARLMGLQRTSVNAAAAVLTALGAVKAVRGRITISDPAALERAACCSRRRM